MCIMKFSALNVDFNSASFDPLCLRRPPYDGIKFGCPLKNARFLLLSTNLARERLQMDTDLLRIITSTAEELSGGTNMDDLVQHLDMPNWMLHICCGPRLFVDLCIGLLVVNLLYSWTLLCMLSSKAIQIHNKSKHVGFGRNWELSSECWRGSRFRQQQPCKRRRRRSIKHERPRCATVLSAVLKQLAVRHASMLLLYHARVPCDRRSLLEENRRL